MQRYAPIGKRVFRAGKEAQCGNSGILLCTAALARYPFPMKRHCLCLLLLSATLAKEDPIQPEDRDWWAFQPIGKTEPPAVKKADWCVNEIDRFVLAKLQAADLAPAPGRPARDADPARLHGPDRPPAAARKGEGLRRGHLPRRLDQGDRRIAGRPRLRRALGPALARHRPLRRIRRLQARRLPARRLALPRLRHPRPQRGPALAALRAGATRGRRDLPHPIPRRWSPPGCSGSAPTSTTSATSPRSGTSSSTTSPTSPATSSSAWG